MLGTYSYHQIIKKTVVSFGTLFNNIQIRHQDENGGDTSLIKVPIAYGPTQKFLARLEQKPDPRKRVALTLPRMSFEISSIRYDASRKVSTMQTFNARRNEGNQVKVFMPVPYNLGIELNIIAKYNDDMLQIIEQILPYFQPHFNLTIDLVSSIGEKRDIPMVIDGDIKMNDNYETGFDERRILIYTINFIAKTFMFGPVAESSDSLIKKVQVDYHSSTDRANSSRQLRYVATPRALKDYNSDESTSLAQDITDKVTIFEVSNGSILTENSYIQIGDEVMYIEEINNNTIKVIRSENSTSSENHFEGDNINAITVEDDEMIEFGDDFGFNEDTFDFGDGRIFSTTKNSDVDL